MTDYKNLKLIATSNPHIRGSETTRSIMLDVIIAMCPALIWAIIYFGVEALLLTAVSVIGCVVFEGLYRKLMHKPQSIDDLSAVVTGMLLAFVCPATTPLWMILIGDFFAIIVVKQLFGGIGKNFLNPALAGRAALLASYAGAMTTWLPAGTKAAIGGGMPVDVVSAATPLAYLKTGDLEGLKQIASVGDMFLGKVGGSMGEVSALMLLIGGLYLIWRKVINWQTPVAYIATVAVLTVLFPKAGGAEYMLYSIFGGGLFLGAFFMATDYVTSPNTPKGEVIFGIGAGLLVVFIRYFGGYEMVMAVGGMLRAAELKMVILVDGFIMTNCVLAASRLYPEMLPYCIFGHCGDEAGHKRVLDILQAKPLLNLGLRLGEGSGSVCAYPIVDSAVRMINEMHSFQQASITKYF